MRYTVILNGCTSNFISQAEEINGFLSDHETASIKGNTIIFYCEDEKKEALITNAPTACLQLVKVSRYQPENILEILKQHALTQDTDLYLFPSDFAGSELCVRFAYRMAGSSLVGVNGMEIGEEKLICRKAVYSNHMQGEFVLRQKPYCISIAKGCAENKPAPDVLRRVISEVDMTQVSEDSFVKSYEFTAEVSPSGLEHVGVLMVAGRGVKKQEKAERLEEIAGALGAALGVSRPVAMNGWVPMNRLIGVSGVMAKPELCITAGVSGAAALFAGIEKSKYIIAINTDERASIVKSSDVAIIDDYEKVLEELLKIVKASE